MVLISKDKIEEELDKQKNSISFGAFVVASVVISALPLILSIIVFVIFIIRKRIAAEITARKNQGQLRQHDDYAPPGPYQQNYSGNYPVSSQYPTGTAPYAPTQTSLPADQNPGRMHGNAYMGGANNGEGQPLMQN